MRQVSRNPPMTTYIQAKCHCGLNSFKLAFKTSELPLSTAACHCNSCRHTTGQMLVIDVPIQGVPLSSTAEGDVAASLEGLTAYNSSKDMTRYFCTKCSAYFFFHNGIHDVWAVFSGVLEKVDEVLNVSHHIWVEDTLDGGIADHYRTVNDVVLPRYAQRATSETLPLGWKAKELATKADTETHPLHCHCKAISLALTRATEIKDPQEYWLVPGKEDGAPIRFIAAHCFCSDCRLSSGSQIQSWVIVPRVNVIDASTSASVDPETTATRPKGLKQYESSPGKFREFCGTCGATVFWWREGISHFDLSAGLVDQEAGGARAKKWLSWYDRIIHPKDAISPATLAALTEGVKAAKAEEV